MRVYKVYNQNTVSFALRETLLGQFFLIKSLCYTTANSSTTLANCRINVARFFGPEETCTIVPWPVLFSSIGDVVN